MNSFTTPLIKWYQHSKRDLPWRQTTNPYLIWVSEIILQQTRVDQGMSYYEKFIKTFPTLAHLANASFNDVLLVWQGLGYYRRAQNLHNSAKLIFNTLPFRFPSTYVELKKLDGIGDYTAAAIASIAFQEPVAAIDGNVMRVWSRVFCLSHPMNSPQLKKKCSDLMAPLLGEAHPGDINQALMELGATVCKPGDPMCDQCPLKQLCKAHQSGNQRSYPLKAPKPKTRTRFFLFLVSLHSRDQTPCIWIEQRGAGDIWQGLYQFPMIETNAPPDSESLAHLEPLTSMGLTEKPDIQKAVYVKHKLTHQTLHCWFINTSLEKPLTERCISLPMNETHRFAFPRPILNYLHTYLKPEIESDCTFC